MCFKKITEKMKRINMTSGQKKLWHVLEFLIRLIILSIPLYLVILLAIDLTPLQNAVAGQTAQVLRYMGYEVLHQGYQIIIGPVQNHFYFMINQDCTGWKSMLFLFALIFAVPRIDWKKKVLGLVIGIPIIWIGNLTRVIGVVLAERSWGVDIALSLHDYGYMIGLVILVLIIWIIWLKLSTKKKKNVWGKLSDLFRLRMR